MLVTSLYFLLDKPCYCRLIIAKQFIGAFWQMILHPKMK